jgi:chromosome partitioning protein
VGVSIAAVSGKGGTGKTTTVVNLAAALAERGHSVLAVDMDPQANLTSGLGYDPYTLTETIFQALTGESPNGTSMLTSEFGVTVLPSSPGLSTLEASLPSSIGREFLLRDLLARLTNNGMKYEFVLIDTPPNFGFHTLSALAAADYVLIPVQMSGFAIKGLKEVLRTLKATRSELNTRIRVLGILPTFVNPRTNFSRDALSALKDFPNLTVFDTYVRQTVKLAETSLYGVPITRYAAKSDVAQAYRELAQEVVAHTREKAVVG